MIDSVKIVVVIRDLEPGPDNAASDCARFLTKHGYQVEYVKIGQDPVPAIRRHSPIAVCFQFDYPDLLGLAELRLTKQLLPAVPLLMITQAHSEQLAIWAFRTRIWDYFVQPFDTARLLEDIDTLTNIRKGVPAAMKRTSLDLINAIPPEARVRCSAGSREEQSVVDQTLTYLDANLHKKIVQSEVAELFGLSPFQFSRLFKRLTRMTFQAYLLSRRIDEAKRLLANPRVSVTDICFTVGFQDLSYFTRIFQRYVGVPPSRYRMSLNNTAEPARAGRKPREGQNAAIRPMPGKIPLAPDRPAQVALKAGLRLQSTSTGILARTP